MSVGSFVAGIIEQGGDEDWFQFSASANRRYQITTTLGGLTDSKLYVYRADGTQLAENDNYGGSLASRVTVDASSAQTLFFKIVASGSNQTGGYQVQVEDAGALITTLLNVSQYIGWNQVRRWSVQPPAGTTLTVQMTGTNASDLYVRRGSQPTWWSYDCRPYAGSSNETCVVNGGETVHIMVHGYSWWGSSISLVARAE